MIITLYGYTFEQLAWLDQVNRTFSDEPPILPYKPRHFWHLETHPKTEQLVRWAECKGIKPPTELGCTLTTRIHPF